MGYEIKIDSKTNVVLVKYVGQVSLSDRLEAVKSVCELQGTGSKKKLLIDVTEAENIMTDDEQERFGEYLAKKKELKDAKVAVVTTNSSNHPNTIINASAYMNGYTLGCFISREKASSWLNTH
jgi:hypothetical protein